MRKRPNNANEPDAKSWVFSEVVLCTLRLLLGEVALGAGYLRRYMAR